MAAEGFEQPEVAGEPVVDRQHEGLARYLAPVSGVKRPHEPVQLDHLVAALQEGELALEHLGVGVVVEQDADLAAGPGVANEPVQAGPADRSGEQLPQHAASPPPAPSTLAPPFVASSSS